VDRQQDQFVRVLTGVAITAGFAFLFLTKNGKQLLNSAEPWLDEVINDMQRLRGAAGKVREAVDEGRRSFEAVAKLGSFSNDDQTWASDASRH
jgi:hypothetical protein